MRIALLTSNHHRHRYFANYLGGHLPVEVVVSERKVAEPTSVGNGESEDRLLQAYFAQRLKAEQEILEGGESFSLPPGVEVLETEPASINAPEVLERLTARSVDTLGVFGTSLLKEPLLSAFCGRIVNIHLGLSPYYRGAGTNFWALYNEDLHLAGATIHYIDAGVDTGEIICHVHDSLCEPGIVTSYGQWLEELADKLDNQEFTIDDYGYLCPNIM